MTRRPTTPALLALIVVLVGITALQGHVALAAYVAAYCALILLLPFVM